MLVLAFGPVRQSRENDAGVVSLTTRVSVNGMYVTVKFASDASVATIAFCTAAAKDVPDAYSPTGRITAYMFIPTAISIDLFQTSTVYSLACIATEHSVTLLTLRMNVVKFDCHVDDVGHTPTSRQSELKLSRQIRSVRLSLSPTSMHADAVRKRGRGTFSRSDGNIKAVVLGRGYEDTASDDCSSGDDACVRACVGGGKNGSGVESGDVMWGMEMGVGLLGVRMRLHATITHIIATTAGKIAAA